MVLFIGIGLLVLFAKIVKKSGFRQIGGEKFFQVRRGGF
jgi:hypothetical protein